VPSSFTALNGLFRASDFLEMTLLVLLWFRNTPTRTWELGAIRPPLRFADFTALAAEFGGIAENVPSSSVNLAFVT